MAPRGARVEVTIGLDRFDAYTGTPVEAPNFAPAWLTGADAPVARAALAARRGRARSLAVLHQRQRHGGARDPDDRLRARRRDARAPRRRAHRARRAARGRARLRDARRGADGRGGERSSPTRAPARSTPTPPPTPWPSIARCPATRRRRSSTRARPRRRSASRGCWSRTSRAASGCPSFKILGASWAIHACARASAATGPRLACATDGNHGRAVARMARRLRPRGDRLRAGRHDRRPARGDRRRGRAGRGRRRRATTTRSSGRRARGGRAW